MFNLLGNIAGLPEEVFHFLESAAFLGLDFQLLGIAKNGKLLGVLLHLPVENHPLNRCAPQGKNRYGKPQYQQGEGRLPEPQGNRSSLHP